MEDEVRRMWAWASVLTGTSLMHCLLTSNNIVIENPPIDPPIGDIMQQSSRFSFVTVSADKEGFSTGGRPIATRIVYTAGQK